MSDRYVLVPTTLPPVGKRYEWIELGSEAMRSARKRKGLSYEATGWQLGVVAKTYERWEKRGEVPRHEVPKVAAVLELEIEMPESTAMRIILPEEQLSDEETRAAEILRRLGRIEEALGIAPDDQGEPQPPRAANGHD